MPISFRRASNKRLRVDGAVPVGSLNSVLQFARGRHLPLSIEFAVLSQSSLVELCVLRGCSRAAGTLVVDYLAQATFVDVRRVHIEAVPLLVASCRRLHTVRLEYFRASEFPLPRLIMNCAAHVRSVSRAVDDQTVVALSHCPNVEHAPKFQGLNGLKPSCLQLFLARVPALRSLDTHGWGVVPVLRQYGTPMLSSAPPLCIIVLFVDLNVRSIESREHQRSLALQRSTCGRQADSGSAELAATPDRA